MIRSVLVLLVVWMGCALAVAAPTTKPGVIVDKDIPYVTAGDRAQRLDLFLPDPPPAKPLPLIIWVHGGGWQHGTKTGGPMQHLVAAGYIAASVEYRFSQKAKFPAQIQDCQAAVRFLRANADKYHIDPDRIGAWGASAGGHLVSLLGTAGGKNAFPPVGEHDTESDRVQAVCNYFGPTDFSTVARQAVEDTTVKNIYSFDGTDPYTKLLGVKRLDDPAKTTAVSPIHYVSKESPPFLIVHGTADTLVPYLQSVKFTEALKSAGVDAALQTVPRGGHGGEEFHSPAMLQLVVRFFDKHLKGIDTKIDPLPESAFPPPATTRTTR